MQFNKNIEMKSLPDLVLTIMQKLAVKPVQILKKRQLTFVATETKWFF